MRSIQGSLIVSGSAPSNVTVVSLSRTVAYVKMGCGGRRLAPRRPFRQFDEKVGHEIDNVTHFAGRGVDGDFCDLRQPRAVRPLQLRAERRQDSERFQRAVRDYDVGNGL